MNFLNKILLVLVVGFVSTVNASDIALKSMIRTVYPETILQFGDKHELFKYILEGTNYKVYVGKNAPDDAREILSEKIGFQIKGKLTTKYDALLMAAGEDNSIVVDTRNKLISVTRSPNSEN